MCLNYQPHLINNVVLLPNSCPAQPVFSWIISAFDHRTFPDSVSKISHSRPSSSTLSIHHLSLFHFRSSPRCHSFAAAKKKQAAIYCITTRNMWLLFRFRDELSPHVRQSRLLRLGLREELLKDEIDNGVHEMLGEALILKHGEHGSHASTRVLASNDVLR